MAEVYGNRYEVIERVGDGGMASVYRGTDMVLRRDVAIKVMHPHLASRQDARARFTREAQNIARLKHPNIVDVYDFSVGSEEESYLVTEFVHGETLTSFVSAHGPFLPQAAALVCHAMAGAMSHAHTAGLIHRDIKPDNLMISRDGQLKLMDFGIATAVDMEGMTATGAIVGSPAHMAPEQIEGEEPDPRCDIFASGIVLYFLVTRRLPFQAANAQALFRQILEGIYEPAARHNPAVDRHFDAIIQQCLARHKADRYATAADLQTALGNYLKQFRMSDVATLLPRFLKAPELFQFDLKPALVTTWVDEGRRYAEAGQVALSIDAYQRALAIDADAEEAKKALNQLTSRSKRRRRVLRVASIALGLLAVAGAAWAWHALQPAAEVPPTGVANWVSGGLPAGQPTLTQVKPVSVPVPLQPPVTAPVAAVAEPQAPTPVQVAVAERRGAPKKQPAGEGKSAAKKPDSVAVVPPPPPIVPAVFVDVQLSCVPGAADLYFRKTKYAGIERFRLEPGGYTFVCDWTPAACPGCEPLTTQFSISPKDVGGGTRMIKAFRKDAPGYHELP